MLYGSGRIDIPVDRLEPAYTMKNNKKSSGRLRIAFAYTHNEGWTAGAYYFKNLFYALRTLPEEIRPVIILLVRKKATGKEFDELVLCVDEVLYQPVIVKNTSYIRLLNNLGKRLGFKLIKENPLSFFLKRHGVDVLFTRGIHSSSFLLPFLSWIPDFQHHHYPEFFDEGEIAMRDASFELVARTATRVVLSSGSALKDFIKFAPSAFAKARVISFVAQIPGEAMQQNPGYVCKKYCIPERFILLPNQFWKHKNHEIVIRALQIALILEPELTIVCTGNTNESRDLGYFSKLLCHISTAGVRERMILLGLTPRLDLFSLMRKSVAVLQPSLFEGWNTTVEEVKTMGKRLIVSDIPVHREQKAPGAVYFDPVSAESLATALREIFTEGHVGPDLEMEKAAQESLRIRTDQYGNKFMAVVHEAIETFSGDHAN